MSPRHHSDLTPHTMPDGSEVLLGGSDCTWVGNQCIPIPPHRRSIIIPVRPPPPPQPPEDPHWRWIPLHRLSQLRTLIGPTDDKVRTYARRLLLALDGHDTFPPPIVLTIISDTLITIPDGNHRLAAYRLVQSMRPDPLKIRARFSARSHSDLQALTGEG